MNRNSLSEMSGRVMHLAMRFTLNKGNDNPMMQELFLDGMNSDFRKIVERVQSFGFTSTPLPRDEDDKKQSGSQNNSGVEQPKGPAAEGICLFLGGQRNHPVCIGIDDRRHHPMGLKPGENAQYDDQGQMTLLHRAGLFMLSLDSKDKDGKTVERFISMRHVEKKKQDRGKVAQKGDGEGKTLTAEQQAAEDQKKQDYKHEGDTVNTEVRCTKNRIEFRAGDNVVGYYDVQKNEWQHKAKTIKNEAESISHKGTQYFDSDIHVKGTVHAMEGVKPGNGDWGDGSPSEGPSLLDASVAGDPVELPPHVTAYVARKNKQAANLEARLAAMEARLAALEKR